MFKVTGSHIVSASFEATCYVGRKDLSLLHNLQRGYEPTSNGQWGMFFPWNKAVRQCG